MAPNVYGYALKKSSYPVQNICQLLNGYDFGLSEFQKVRWQDEVKCMVYQKAGLGGWWR